MLNTPLQACNRGIEKLCNNGHTEKTVKPNIMIMGHCITNAIDHSFMPDSRYLRIPNQATLINMFGLHLADAPGADE